MFKCHYCDEEFDYPIQLANHTRLQHKDLIKKSEEIKQEPKSEKLIPTYDKSNVISPNIQALKEERDALILQRQIDRLSAPPQQANQLTPDSMFNMFKMMLESMNTLLQQQKQTSLTDELTKFSQLKELASSIASGEIPTEEGLSDKQLMEGIMEVVKAQTAKQQPPPSIPQQEIIQQAQNPNKVYPLNQPKESENMELIDLLTPEARKKIASLPKDMAWSLCRSFLAISEEEFNEIYEKCKRMSDK